MSRRPRSLLAPALLLGALGCGNTFEPQASIQSLRVMAVQVDKPYAKPGDTVQLDMLLFDGSKRGYDAQGKHKREPQILWLGGCHDPPGDLYYGCFPVLAQLFSSLGGGAGGAGGAGGGPGGLPPGSLDLLDYVGTGTTFRFKVPADIITRRPPEEIATLKSQGNTPYGLSYAFFVVCGGTIKPLPADQVSGATLPLGCFDNETGERLGPDDLIIGYTPVYSYDEFTNKNPVLGGMLFQNKPSMDKACSADADCGAADTSRCGSQKLCIPVVHHCTERKAFDCDKYRIKPVLDKAANVEKDLAAPPIDGQVLEEVIWISFYSSDGLLANDTILVNDATKGWVFDGDKVKGTEWSPPNAAAGEARIWVVVHDNRGGTSWAWQDVFVD